MAIIADLVLGVADGLVCVSEEIAKQGAGPGIVLVLVVLVPVLFFTFREILRARLHLAEIRKLSVRTRETSQQF